MSKLFPLLAVLVVLTLISCKKKEHATPEEIPVKDSGTVTEQKLAGTYHITKVEARTGTQRADITNTWYSTYAGDCAKDDITIFNPDESFVVLDGTITCDESTDDTGTWKLLSNTQLKLDNDTTAIEAFTATSLRIISPVYSKPDRTIIFTYTRQ